jgi:glycosyltransferase involved in cell wall biosynthesis
MGAARAGRHVLVLNWRDTRHPLGGGSETYIESIAEQLCARGHRVTIVCALYRGAAREEAQGGVQFIRRGGRLTVYPWAALLYLAGAIGLGPLSRRRLGRPDVIIDVGNGLPFLSPLYSRVPVIELVHHVHREQWPVVMPLPLARFGWWVESWLAPRVYRRCRYVTVSGATRAELVGLGIDEDRISVIHNGTPPVTEEPTPRDSWPHLVVLCRLVPHKRVEVAMRAVAALAPQWPELTLTVAGQGWWEPKLRELAETLGMTDRVHFVGHVTEEAKHDLFSRAWIALNPSLKEGWGLTIVEAGARGTPTVAMAGAGGVAEAILDGESGLLATNEEHFIGLVGELLRDDERREAMGVVAAKHAQSFNWEESGALFVEVIEEAGLEPLLRHVALIGIPEQRAASHQSDRPTSAATAADAA